MSEFLKKSAAYCSFSDEPCLMFNGEVGRVLGDRGVLESRSKGACERCIRLFNTKMRMIHFNDRLDSRHVVPRTYRDDPTIYRKVLVLDAALIEKNRGNGFFLPINNQLVIAIGGPGCYRTGGHEAIDCVPVGDDPHVLHDENMWFTAYRSEVLGVANIEAIMFYLKSYVFHNYKGAFITELCRLEKNIVALGGDVSCLPFSSLVPRRTEFQDSFLVC